MKKTSLTILIISIIFMPSLNNTEGLNIGGTIDTDIISPPPPVNLPILLSAKDDNAVTNEDSAVRINVLSNDQYTGIGSLKVTSVTSPSSGTAAINADNTVTYTPNSNFFGSDSFDYAISDGTGLLTDTATVSIMINSVNDAPIANDDTAVINENTPVDINVLANDMDSDNDSLTITSVTQGANGRVVINADNTVKYEPNLDFDGQDSFTYAIADGNGGTDNATVSIAINDVIDLISKVSSGLVASDPLNNETKTMQDLQATNGTYWTYGGSANSLFIPPAPRDLFQDAEGLHIGVQWQQSPTNATYAGYYAVTPPTNAKLFHAMISTPLRTIDNNFFQNGLYVQTGPQDGRINYVTCVSITSNFGTTWHIVRTFGNFTVSTHTEFLWSDFSANQSLTKDCTIITDGINYLKVYLDGDKKYESNTIDLQMPAPFTYFLEPQNSHAQMLYGIYKDFYATSDETIKVTNNPVTASRVDVVDTSGNVLASAQVTNGVATVNIGQYHFPLAANIKVYDSANNVIASTSSSANMFGGDVYSIS